MLMMLVSTALGVTLLARRFRPVLPAVLLALFIPCALVVVEVTSLGSVALPVMFAFGILGRHLASGGSIAVARSRAERRQELAGV
jgi:hypothetical protein